MPCYKPMPAVRRLDGSVTFESRQRVDGNTLWLACGQCVGCRLERSRQWAMRCMHEASLHDLNCFITLTYDDDHCPPDMSLDYSHFQLFMKRLRKHFSSVVEYRDGSQIKKTRVFLPLKFYMAGEYGETNPVTKEIDGGRYRPHFHACLFGVDFVDKVPVRFLCRSELFTSPTLEKLWTYGASNIGRVNFESAAYVARYCMKKITGDKADEAYRYIDDDGVVTQRVPEFNRMSLGGRGAQGGVGSKWLDRYHSDVYPDGTCIVRGKECNSPRYYDKLLKRDDPDGYAHMLYMREQEMRLQSEHQSDERLAVREEVAKARVKSFSRSL